MIAPALVSAVAPAAPLRGASIAFDRPYVYSLAYPDGRVFYIGKGRGYRIRAHRSHAKENSYFNAAKEAVIQGIWAQGQQVVETVLAYFETDEEALLCETALIFLMDGLTNLRTVGEPLIEFYRKEEAREREIAERQARLMAVMADTNLKRIRQQLGVSQEGVARRTRTVSTGTVKNAENGRKVEYGNAVQILEAINVLLRERGESPVTLDDLGLTLL